MQINVTYPALQGVAWKTRLTSVKFDNCYNFSDQKHILDYVSGVITCKKRKMTILQSMSLFSKKL